MQNLKQKKEHMSKKTKFNADARQTELLTVVPKSTNCLWWGTAPDKLLTTVLGRAESILYRSHTFFTDIAEYVYIMSGMRNKINGD